MADEVKDAAYWQRARDEMNAVFAAEEAIFDQAEREKQEIRARRRAAEKATHGSVIDVRWNAVAVPTTSGPGGTMVTVGPQRRRRWRWF